MIVNSSTQIRVIRAWLGMSSKDFSARLGVCPASLTGWERGRARPGPGKRKALAELCREHAIGFMPSGMPVPFAFFPLKPGEFTGWDSSLSPKDECVRAPEVDDSTAADRKPAGRPRGSKNMDRRGRLLKELNVDPKYLESQPQIAPLLKQCGILPARVIGVLRADENEYSHTVVKLWDSLSRASQNILGLDAIAVAAGLTPRRLWEIYWGVKVMKELSAKTGRGARGAT